MNNQKSLKCNFIMNAILAMSKFIFPLITFPYVSRILLPVGTGKVAFATSLISYFLMFAQLGIPTYGIRMCAQLRDDRQELTRTAHELLAINLIMAALSYGLLAIALVTIPRLYEDKTLYVVISFTIILNAMGMEWLYQALEQYTYITLRSLAFKTVALAAMFLLVHKQEDYVLYGGITILASSASNIFNLINVHKYIDMKPVGNYNLRKHLKPVAVFFAMACATTIYTHLDTVMLGFMATDEDVGFYNAAVKIKTILVSIVTSLGTVLLPRASYYVRNGQMDRFWAISKKAISFVLLTAMPMSLYFVFFAREGIYFLSGSAYFGAVLPMQIIMPTLLFIGLTNILGIQILVPLGKEKIVLYSELAGAVTDIVINLLLIPRYVASGAAIGTVAAEFVVLAVQYSALRGEIQDAFKAVQYFRLAGALIAGSAASLWVKLLNWGAFATMALSAVLFFGVYAIVLLAAKEPMAVELFDQLTRASRKRME